MVGDGMSIGTLPRYSILILNSILILKIRRNPCLRGPDTSYEGPIDNMEKKTVRFENFHPSASFRGDWHARSPLNRRRVRSMTMRQSLWPSVGPDSITAKGVAMESSTVQLRWYYLNPLSETLYFIGNLDGFRSIPARWC